MPRREIDDYIADLQYDPRALLSVVPDGVTSTVPTKSRTSAGTAVVICTKTDHTLKKNLDEVAILSPTAGVIFPGALVCADEKLVEGRPTPIGLPRAPVTLAIDLPGHGNPSASVTPASSEVQKFVNARLEEWNQVAGSQGYTNAARSMLQTTKAFSSQQVALDLGFSAKWAAGSASAQLGAKSSAEKSVIVAYYKQVYYTVTMDTPASPADVFSDNVTLEQARKAFSADHPPAYVRSVDYGRILLIKMETSASATAADLKAAFEQVTSGGVSAGGKLSSTYSGILRNSDISVLAVGGGAETPLRMFRGAADGGLDGLQETIAGDARYRRNNPGLPIAYTVAFLKDNQFARIGSATDYTETECVRYDNGCVRLVHGGSYVARFEVTWLEADPNGDYSIKQKWESGSKTAGYAHQVDLPGDAQNVRIKAWADTGLAWDKWGEIMSVSLGGPDNKTYRVTGTTLKRTWDNG